MALSDRTKTYLVVSAVVVVAGANVLFGLRQPGEPAPVRAPATAALSDAATTPAQTVPLAPALPATRANNPNAAAQARDAGVAIMQEEPPKCDVAVCAAAYHSFRAEDCMYQPSNGPRRLCTKGRPPR